MVEIENLTYAYPNTSPAALEGVGLTVERGEFVLLAGPSGCGKSTLLRAIASLVPHFYGGRFDGSVLVDGHETRHTKPARLAGTVGFVFQDPEAQMVSTGIDAEVAFGLENAGLAPAQITRRVEETLVAMGISGLRGRAVAELSGGQLQKVALASVLAMQPELLLLDEPTSQLDPVAAESLLASLRRLSEEMGTTIILAEHRLDRCYHAADRVVLMADGRISCDDDPRSVAAAALASGDAFVPPVSRVFAGYANGNLPLTVKEGRALLASGKFELEANGTSSVSAGDTHLPRAERDSAGGQQPAGGCPAVEVRGLSFVYPSGLEALDGCDLTVGRGDFLALMGENGAGKSTLVKHFIGLLRSPRGSVKLFGKSVQGVATEELAQTCALLGQNPNDYLFSETLRDELAFTMVNLAPDAPAGRIEETLELLGLARYADENPRLLSAGERQRAALASLLVCRPPLVVLDEPTRGMDYLNKAKLGALLVGLRDKGTTIIVVTHDVEFAATYADRVALMGRGRVIAEGPKHEIMDGAVFLAPQANKLMRGFAAGVLTIDEARHVLATAGGRPETCELALAGEAVRDDA